MKEQTTQDLDFSSSVNVARRGDYGRTGGRPNDGRFGNAQSGRQQSGGRQGGGGSNNYHSGGGYQGSGQQGGHGGNRSDGGPGGSRTGGGGNDGRRSRPRCQICGIWGHGALTCRNRFNQVYQADSSRSGNAASTSQGNNVHPPWYIDSGATDHLTNDLERLNVQERYHGRDQVQVANGAGLSISHIGHSSLAGSVHSLALKNILHVPNISKNLLSVHRIVSDNDVFIEFHRHFFCVKDKATKNIILQGRSRGGLYPVPFHRASSSTTRHAFSGVKLSFRQWHQRLGHPSNNVVQSTVKNNSLLCSPNSDSSVCDACQRAKSHQLPYNHSTRVSTAPLELVHTDVWGPALSSSGGYKYYVSFVDDYSRHCWIYLLKHKSDVEDIFYIFQAHVERFLNNKIRAVQSDWGGEYHRLNAYFVASAFSIVFLAHIRLNKMVLLNKSIDTSSRLA
jgi:histone deacetylase 1/2